MIAKQKESLDSIMKKLDEFQNLKIELETTKFTQSIDKIIVGVNDVIAKLKSITTEAPVEIDISKVDLSITTVIGKIEKIKEAAEKIKETKMELSVEGKGGVLLQDYMDLTKITLEAFKTFIGELDPAIETAFKAIGYEDKSINEVVSDIKAQVESLASGEGSINSVKPELEVQAKVIGVSEEAQNINSGIEAIKTKIGEIPKETTSTHTITVTGLGDLVSAIKYHSDLKDKATHSYHTIHVSTVEDGESGSSEDAGNQRTGGYIAARVGGFIQHLRKGGAFSGSLPGYGGGDIVNARLEPGEFVLRKEAVQNIGVNALRQWNNLNSSAMKSLNPQSGSSKTDSLFTGQLHTVNLNIGDQSHKVYAEPNVLNSLTSSLRRARLMKA